MSTLKSRTMFYFKNYGSQDAFHLNVTVKVIVKDCKGVIVKVRVVLIFTIF